MAWWWFGKWPVSLGDREVVGKGLNMNTLPWKVSSTRLMEPKCKLWQELHISS